MNEDAVDSGDTKRALEVDKSDEDDEREVKRLKQSTEPTASDNVEQTEVSTKDVDISNDATNDCITDQVNQVDVGINYNKKKKCVLLLSYCGSGYSGMQRNPGVATIEEDLTNALLKANAISEDASRNYGKHMVPYAKLLPEINKHLKPQIRVFALKKVTRGFDCKNRCSSRTYEYLIPTLAFSQSYAHTAPNFRIANDLLERINNILSMYVGTHNFHNFTSGKAFKEESAKRYMMDICYVDTPFVEQGMEFLSLRIKGQSFMQHQIRKMIGLLVAIIRNCTDKDAITRAFQEPKMDIPRAPGLGLILDQVDFESYNKKFGKDKIHEPLVWDDHEEEIRQFKNAYIYKTIIDTEVKTNSMSRWLSTLSSHTYGSNGMEKPQEKRQKTEEKKENTQKMDELGENRTENNIETDQKTEEKIEENENTDNKEEVRGNEKENDFKTDEVEGKAEEKNESDL